MTTRKRRAATRSTRRRPTSEKIDAERRGRELIANRDRRDVLMGRWKIMNDAIVALLAIFDERGLREPRPRHGSRTRRACRIRQPIRRDQTQRFGHPQH
ncbi:MAG: hypothetical protein NT062_34050 [Proteobacteria bacterium]|nr:hypothetical protein [Pseudomonadota bacterium]